MFFMNIWPADRLLRLPVLPPGMRRLHRHRLHRHRLQGRRYQPSYLRRQILASLLGAVIGFVVLGLIPSPAGSGGVGISRGYGLIVAPFGATAVLLFGNPGSPLAQPRNVVMGSAIAALVSVLCVQLLGPAPWVMGLAVGATMALGQRLRCLHPPAGALAVLGVLQHAQLSYLCFPVLPGAVLLVLLAALYHRISGLGHRYPVHWL